jgi:hypothetical protein
MITEAVKGLLGVEPAVALTYFLCVVIGVLINWAKRCRELDIGLLAYWTTNPVRSQTAIIGTIAAFAFTIITDPESSKLTYMAIGFACDNLLNKVPVTGAAADVIARQEAAIQVQEAKMQEIVQQLPDAPKSA